MLASRSRLAASVLALALFLVTSPSPTTSVAQRGTVRLEWTAPADECADADAVLDDALVLLGDVPPPESALGVVATVTTSEQGYALVLRVGPGERKLDATACDELARASALLIAMAIDPTVVTRLPEPEPAPEPAIPEPAEPEPTEPAEPGPAEPEPEPTPPTTTRGAASRPTPTRRRVPLHASASIGAGVGLFALPRATADLELAITLSPGPARIELGGSYWTPARRDSPGNAAVGGEFQLGAAVVRGCWVPKWRTIELPLCAALHAGLMRGRGTGAIPESLSASAPWVALGGGPMLLWRPRRTSGRLGVWARVEGLGTLARPVFVTTPSGLLWRAREGALLATAGVELRFWSRP